jgi:hypothetical protein
MFAVYATHAAPDDPLSALKIGERPEPDVPQGWVRVTTLSANRLAAPDPIRSPTAGTRPAALVAVCSCPVASPWAPQTLIDRRGSSGFLSQRWPCS